MMYNEEVAVIPYLFQNCTTSCFQLPALIQDVWQVQHQSDSHCYKFWRSFFFFQDNPMFFQYVCRWQIVCMYGATAAWICALLSRTTTAVISLLLRGSLEVGLSKTMKKKIPRCLIRQGLMRKDDKTALSTYNKWLMQGNELQNLESLRIEWMIWVFFLTAAYRWTYLIIIRPFSQSIFCGL